MSIIFKSPSANNLKHSNVSLSYKEAISIAAGDVVRLWDVETGEVEDITVEQWMVDSIKDMVDYALMPISRRSALARG